LVRGKVTETLTGKPLAAANVEFLPRLKDNPSVRDDIVTGDRGMVVTGKDGQFQITVLPGPGHLCVLSPTADYIQIEMHSSKIHYDRPGGARMYAHAWAPLSAKSGDTLD